MKQLTLPALNKKQLIAIDQLMVNSYGISLIQRMENAGRNLALLSQRLLDGYLSEKKICVAIGSGNSGGTGLVAARHLSNWGAEVTIFVATPGGSLKHLAARELEVTRQLPISVVFANNQCCQIMWGKFDLILDAILGYGLNRAPSGDLAHIIRTMNQTQVKKIALDLPSGLDPTIGYVSDTVVHADATLTLALPKRGLLTEEARHFVGALYLGDISVPPLLYCQLGLEVHPRLFENDPIVAL